MGQRKYIFVYFERVELCKSPEEAIMFIDSLKAHNNSRSLPLQCGGRCEEKVYALFYGEIEYLKSGVVSKISYEDKIYAGFSALHPNGSGSTFVKFYPALADTLEEHTRIFKEQIEQAQIEKIEESKQRIANRAENLSRYQEGLYAVELFFWMTVCTKEQGSAKGLELYKGNIFATSGMDAYDKTVTFLKIRHGNKPSVSHIEFPRPSTDYYKFNILRTDVIAE